METVCAVSGKPITSGQARYNFAADRVSISAKYMQNSNEYFTGGVSVLVQRYLMDRCFSHNCAMSELNLSIKEAFADQRIELHELEEIEEACAKMEEVLADIRRSIIKNVDLSSVVVVNNCKVICCSDNHAKCELKNDDICEACRYSRVVDRKVYDSVMGEKWKESF